MRGPFRIAAAGLCTAFLWTVVAAVSHFRNESVVLAQRELRQSDHRIALRDALPGQATDSPMKLGVRVPEPPRDSFATEPSTGATISRAVPPIGDAHSAAIEIRPELGPLDGSASFPTAVVSSASPTRKEFLFLPPPPEYRDEIDAVDSAAANGNPRVLAELATMRRDLDRFLDRQTNQRLAALEENQRRLAERQTEETLAELKQTVDQLRSEAALQQSQDELQHETAAAPSADPAQSPVTLSPAETESPPIPKADFPAPTPKPAADPIPKGPIAISPASSPGAFDFVIEGARIDVVLAALGDVGHWNLVVSPDVGGEVTAVWKNVTPQQALDALLAAHHLTSQPQASFLVISNAPPAAAVKEIAAPEPKVTETRDTTVQLYRPMYVAARDLLPLLQPMLTAEIGHMGITLPRTSEEAQLVDGGRDSLAQPDAILVVDYPEVVELIGRTIAEIDVPAPHVELEATILDVQWTGQARSVSQLLACNDGAACVSLDDEDEGCDVCCETTTEPCEDLVQRLRKQSTVRVVSNARLQVLNKQPAELCVGDAQVWRAWNRKEARTEPGAKVLEDATRLWVRPFISGDHLIRMEVEPQTAVATARRGGPQQMSASVRTNVAIPDCGTLVIAGLNVEETAAPARSILKPWERLRGKAKDREGVVRREVVVMISARILRGSEYLAPPAEPKAH